MPSSSSAFISSFLLLALITSCSGPVTKDNITASKDFILKEKDLIPEGLAFDPVSNSIFVSSTHKRKIVRIDSTGVVTDFIKEKQDGIWSTIGMEVDAARRHLWVVSSQANEVLPLIDKDSMQWRSAIYQYSLENGSLIDSVLLPVKNVFLNDLTVAENGDLYVTESMQGGIYYLKEGTDSLVLFLKPEKFTFLNGINFADQPGQLFVSSSEGILKIDIASRGYQLVKTSDSVNAKEIDGLTWYKGSFLGHQSTKLSRFVFNSNRDSILQSTIINSGTEYDSSTTGETGDNNYYFIVNSQIQSGIDFKKQAIKPMDSLENIIIRKISL